MFVIVDYHKGNLSSVQRAFADAGVDARISDAPEDIAEASAIIVPGVGAFADAMAYMEQSGQAQAIKQALDNGAYYFGICLGMQLLFEQGNEHALAGDTSWTPGLGLLPGECVRFDAGDIKVPHMGWNQINLTSQGEKSTLVSSELEGMNMYFTHSYIVKGTSAADVVATTNYGGSFPCIIEHDRIFGCQFHPEKSSRSGSRIIEAFAKIVREGWGK